MKKFSIDITGIHCSGCVGLIKMTLEDDLAFKNVLVNEKDNKAEFQTIDDESSIIVKLDSAFKEDLADYKYSNLTRI